MFVETKPDHLDNKFGQFPPVRVQPNHGILTYFPAVIVATERDIWDEKKWEIFSVMFKETKCVTKCFLSLNQTQIKSTENVKLQHKENAKFQYVNMVCRNICRQHLIGQLGCRCGQRGDQWRNNIQAWMKNSQLVWMWRLSLVRRVI